jgi:hypothetical protein
MIGNVQNISHVYYIIFRNFTVKFHCFAVHFDSLSFIHTNSCTFSYKYILVFYFILKTLKTL